jgi:hypothetical protein
MWVRKKKIIE